MHYTKRALSIILLTFVGCSLPAGPGRIEHTDIIQAEWSLAQDMMSLAPSVGDNAYKVSWDRFKWVAHDGPFRDCKVLIDGLLWPVNGCVIHNKVIHWNTNTPGVIRHEAAHAILGKLGHACSSYVSYDGNKVVFHKYKKKNSYCAAWIDLVWGNL